VFNKTFAATEKIYKAMFFYFEKMYKKTITNPLLSFRDQLTKQPECTNK